MTWQEQKKQESNNYIMCSGQKNDHDIVAMHTFVKVRGEHQSLDHNIYTNRHWQFGHSRGWIFRIGEFSHWSRHECELTWGLNPMHKT